MPTPRTNIPDDTEWLARYLLRLHADSPAYYRGRIQSNPQEMALRLQPAQWRRMQAAYRKHRSREQDTLARDYRLNPEAHVLLDALGTSPEKIITAYAIGKLGEEWVAKILADYRANKPKLADYQFTEDWS